MGIKSWSAWPPVGALITVGMFRRQAKPVNSGMAGTMANGNFLQDFADATV
jgi:hypothetical protein